MATQSRLSTILIAEDDADDMAITMRALRDGLPDAAIKTVRDGEELMDYLRFRGEFTQKEEAPRPALILLDLNMPRKSGREALAEIKADAALRTLPIVVLTTSNAQIDVDSSYSAGANAYMTKPLSYSDMLASMKALTDFWFNRAVLPDEPEDN